MKKKLKGFIKNIFTTTGVTLLLITVLAKCLGGSALFLDTVFQAFIANTLIHASMFLLNQLETKYLLADYIVQLTCFLIITCSCNYIFDWDDSMPLWATILITVLVYAAACIFNTMKLNQDLAFINRQLSVRGKGTVQ